MAGLGNKNRNFWRELEDWEVMVFLDMDGDKGLVEGKKKITEKLCIENTMGEEKE